MRHRMWNSADHRSPWSRFLIVTFCLAVFAPALRAQATAHFAFVQTAVLEETLPQALALDNKGNLYIAIDGKIVMKPRTGSNYGADITVNSGFGLSGIAVDSSGTVFMTNSSNPPWVSKATWNSVTNQYDVTELTFLSVIYSARAIAVDSNGDLFIADTQQNRIVMEKPNGSSGYTESVLFTGADGLDHPTGVAVDRRGNVYIVQHRADQVFMETLTAGSDPTKPQSYAKTMVGSSLGTPHSVAVDDAGGIYIADYDTTPSDLRTDGRILKETPLPGGGYAQTVIGGSDLNNDFLSNPQGVAVDADRNVYISNTNQFKVYKRTISGFDFGQINVGANSAKISLNFLFDSPGTVSAPAVLAMGAPNLEFKDAGSGSCNAYFHQFSAGNICSVDVVFSPRQAGTRNGAVVLSASDGSNPAPAGPPIATAYIYGTGVGPQIAFTPPVESTAVSGIVSTALAIDGNGNLYLTDNQNFQLIKETLSGGSYSPSAIGSGLGLPVSVAVDGAGNVYIVDGWSSRVWKETLSNGTYSQSVLADADTTPYGLKSPSAVAVDGSGNVYIADSQGNTVYKETLFGGNYTQSIVSNQFNQPFLVAVDGSGNVFVCDMNYYSIWKETPSAGNYTQSAIPLSVADPFGLFADGSGNLYVAVYENVVLKESLQPDGSYKEDVLVRNDTATPFSVAVDGAGNVYFADPNYNDGRVLKETFASPPSLNFFNTPVGVENWDSPRTATVWNTGNAPLVFPSLATASNPTFPADFVWGAGSLCTQVSAGSDTPFTLSAGANCTIDVGFIPQSAGDKTESVIITDNNLNVVGATQTIAVSGTGIAVDKAPAFTSADNTTFIAGGNGSFTVQASGTPDPTVTMTSGSLPGGVTFNAGLLSGKPAAGTGGIYDISITASNGVNPDAVQAFRLTVNEAPAITSTNSATFTVGKNDSFSVTATGYPVPLISESGALPAGVNFDSGVLSGVPAAGTAGAYPITFTASNSVTFVTHSFTLNVISNATLSTITIAPLNSSIAAGLTQQFAATGHYSDGSTQVITGNVSWTSSYRTVAIITSGGLATGVAQGRTTITAAQGTIRASTTLIVTAPVLKSIDVTPSSATILTGKSQQFLARGGFSDGSTRDITDTVLWSSSDTSIATVRDGGSVKGVGSGTVTITAIKSGISDTATLTVNPVLVSIAVTPANPSIKVGSQLQFAAIGTYSDQSTQDLTTTAKWTSSNTGVATISASGLASGRSAGRTTIKAAVAAVSGSSTLTVTR